jgi:electron transfer flavoprotein beta subunit
MVAQLLNQPFVNASVGLDVNGSEATAVREIEGEKKLFLLNYRQLLQDRKDW